MLRVQRVEPSCILRVYLWIRNPTVSDVTPSHPSLTWRFWLVTLRMTTTHGPSRPGGFRGTLSTVQGFFFLLFFGQL